MLRFSWENIEAVLLGEGIMIHKKFSIKPIAPSCTNIKSPASMQHMERKTKSES